MVYLLVSRENFVRAWRWLGQALQDAGIDVSLVGKNVPSLQKFFDNIRAALFRHLEDHMERIQYAADTEDNVAAVIFLRTLQFCNLQNKQRVYMRKNQCRSKVRIMLLSIFIYSSNSSRPG